MVLEPLERSNPEEPLHLGTWEEPMLAVRLVCYVLCYVLDCVVFFGW